jgi:hypothetical protein
MAEEVDVLLVLAADASGSVSDDRERMQRNGFAAALMNPAFLSAVATGRLGRVAAVYVEWSNYGSQVTALRRGWPSFAPVWTVISDAASAARLATAIPETPRMTPGYTSLSGAIDYGARIIAESGFAAPRRVIDVCADGRNNDGRAVIAARDAAVAEGITINGLAMLGADAELEAYFRAEVIGGPLAFVVAVESEADFAPAVLRKLITEVAAPAPSTRTHGRG